MNSQILSSAVWTSSLVRLCHRLPICSFFARALQIGSNRRLDPKNLGRCAARTRGLVPSKRRFRIARHAKPENRRLKRVIKALQCIQTRSSLRKLWYAKAIMVCKIAKKRQKSKKLSEFQAFCMFYQIFMVCKICKVGIELRLWMHCCQRIGWKSKKIF